MSVKKTASGKWQARYRDTAGKEHTKTYARKQDAEDWERDQRVEMRRGTWVDPRRGREKFEPYAERWRQQRVHRPLTAQTCESDLRKHVYPTFGQRRMDSIRPSDIRAWVKQLEADLAPRTVRRVYSWVASIFRTALLDRDVAANPCDRISLPKVEREQIVPLEPAQVERIAETVPARYRALILFAAGTGLRRSEALGITVDRIDFLRRQVKVDRQLVPNRLEWGPPKSKAGYRTVPLPKSVGDEVAYHLSKFGEGREGLVFSSSTGSQVRMGTISEIMRGAEQPGGYTFHDLRHFYASSLIDAGCSVKLVQRLLGHESAAMTLDVYAELFPNSDDDARAALDAVLGVDRNQQRLWEAQ